MGKLTDKLKSIGNAVKDGVQNKINNVKTNFQENKFLDESFKNEANYVEFTIHFLDKNENAIQGFFKNKIGGLLDKENNKIYFDKAIKMQEGQYLQDNKNNKYYITYISNIPFCYKQNFNDKELVKELTELDFTDKMPDKPLTPIINNITNNDNSTTIKGNKGNINSDNASIEKTTHLDIDTNAHFHIK